MNRRQFIGLGLSAAATPVFAAQQPSNEPRSLTLHNLHTNENLTVTYRIGDRYQRDALQRLNRFMRDHHNGRVSVMDPKLFDLLYDLQRYTGARGAFEVLSAYRSPETNAKLRRASSRVAKRSYHMNGQALDIRHTGASISQLRRAALALERGGVGSYSSFVHVDTGPVRTWRA